LPLDPQDIKAHYSSYFNFGGLWCFRDSVAFFVLVLFEASNYENTTL